MSWQAGTETSFSIDNSTELEVDTGPHRDRENIAEAVGNTRKRKINCWCRPAKGKIREEQGGCWEEKDKDRREKKVGAAVILGRE
jgi:hypothetical protein